MEGGGGFMVTTWFALGGLGRLVEFLGWGGDSGDKVGQALDCVRVGICKALSTSRSPEHSTTPETIPLVCAGCALQFPLCSHLEGGQEEKPSGESHRKQRSQWPT